MLSGFFVVFLFIEIISLIFNERFGMQHMDKEENESGRKLRSGVEKIRKKTFFSPTLEKFARRRNDEF